MKKNKIPVLDPTRLPKHIKLRRKFGARDNPTYIFLCPQNNLLIFHRNKNQLEIPASGLTPLIMVIAEITRNTHAGDIQVEFHAEDENIVVLRKANKPDEIVLTNMDRRRPDRGTQQTIKLSHDLLDKGLYVQLARIAEYEPSGRYYLNVHNGDSFPVPLFRIPTPTRPRFRFNKEAIMVTIYSLALYIFLLYATLRHTQDRDDVIFMIGYSTFMFAALGGAGLVFWYRAHKALATGIIKSMGRTGLRATTYDKKTKPFDFYSEVVFSYSLAVLSSLGLLVICFTFL